MAEPSNKDSTILSILKVVLSLSILGLVQLVSWIFSPKKQFKMKYIGALMILIQWVAFIFASGILGNSPTEKYYDITGSATYILSLMICYFSLQKPSKRQRLTILAALIWSIRLGSFLFFRIHKNKGVDRRFTEIKASKASFLIAWTLQGLWVFFTLLSILTLSLIEDTSELNYFNYAGICVWVTGFLFEVIADHQKFVFRQNPENAQKWISTGLWSISRHPNYFGEILMWVGISLVCYCTDIKPLKLVISPIFVASLLIFLSGIPMLEQSANLHYGSNKEYLQYKEKTPVLIPFIGRAGDARF